LIVALIPGIGKVPAESSATSDMHPKPPSPAEMKIRRPLTDVLDDRLASELRETMHPTGKGGKVKSKNLTCSAKNCTAEFEVEWQGLSGSAYTSVFRWEVAEDFSSSASLVSEDAAFKADDKDIDAMVAHLAEVAAELKGGGRKAPVDPTRFVSDPNRPLTSVELLAQGAHEADELEAMIKGNEWTLYPDGTTDCAGDTTGSVPRPIRLDMPQTDDDFERHTQVAKRAQLAKATGAVGALFRWRWRGTGKPQKFLSPYNFSTKSYTFEDQPTSGRWPALGGSPTFRRESFSLSGEADTGLRVGGKTVAVKTEQEMISFENSSALKLVVPIDVVTAEKWNKEGVDIEWTIVQRFIGLGYHKVCQSTCASILGETVCGPQDVGFGTFYRTEPVGHILRVGGKVISEKQPPKAN